MIRFVFFLCFSLFSLFAFAADDLNSVVVSLQEIDSSIDNHFYFQRDQLTDIDDRLLSVKNINTEILNSLKYSGSSYLSQSNIGELFGSFFWRWRDQLLPSLTDKTSGGVLSKLDFLETTSEEIAQRLAGAAESDNTGVHIDRMDELIDLIKDINPTDQDSPLASDVATIRDHLANIDPDVLVIRSVSEEIADSLGSTVGEDLHVLREAVDKIPEDLFDRVSDYFDSGLDLDFSFSGNRVSFYNGTGHDSSYSLSGLNGTYDYWQFLAASLKGIMFASQASAMSLFHHSREFNRLTAQTSFLSTFFHDVDFAKISFESNSVPTSETLTFPSDDFFASAIRLLLSQIDVQASQTMFLKHILERMPHSDSVDTESEKSELENSLDHVSSQLDSLSQSLEFSDLSFSDRTTIDQHFSTSDFGDVFSSGIVGTIVLSFPAVNLGGSSFGPYTFNIRTDPLVPFIEVSRACFRVFYWLLLASLLWFAFRLFLPFVVTLFKTVKAVFNW